MSMHRVNVIALIAAVECLGPSMSWLMAFRAQKARCQAVPE